MTMIIDGILGHDLMRGARSITLEPASDARKFPTKGIIRIDGEILSFVRDGDRFIVGRAMHLTFDQHHKKGCKVQLAIEIGCDNELHYRQ